MRRTLLTLGLLFSATAVALADGSSPGPSTVPSAPAITATPPAGLTPEQMYLRAMRAMKAEAVPPYVQFREHVQARNIRIACDEHGANLTLKHGDIERIALVSYRSEDASAVSVDLATGKRCDFALLYPAGASLNSLETATPKPGSTAAPDAGQDESGLKIAAAVRVESARDYRVTFAGNELVDGHPAYHLQLAAYREPLKHPLTDLWIDQDTYLVRRARGEAAAHFVVGSGRFEATLTFDRIGGYWIVHSEDASAAANALLVHVRTHILADGSGFTFPDALPGVFPSPGPAPAPGASAKR
jgi:hypothetical protein